MKKEIFFALAFVLISRAILDFTSYSYIITRGTLVFKNFREVV